MRDVAHVQLYTANLQHHAASLDNREDHVGDLFFAPKKSILVLWDIFRKSRKIHQRISLQIQMTLPIILTLFISFF